MTFREYIDVCSAVQDEAALFEAFKAFTATEANVWAYQHISCNLRRIAAPASDIFRCEPEGWSAIYKERNYFAIDPITAACRKARGPFHWYDIGQIIRLTPQQQGLLDEMRRFGFVDGIVFVIHQGIGALGFVTLGSTERPLAIDAERLYQLWSASHRMHMRYMEMRAIPAKDELGLSRRETEVITLLAQGKSNASIAKTLGVSDHTVDTLVRRSFLKLGVTDRISAALKAVGSGTIQI